MNIPKIKSEFISHVITLMMGRTGALLISFLAVPFIARLFLPSDFGVVSIFVALILVVGEICTLRYPMAAILPDNENNGIEILRLSIFILNVFVILMYFFLFISIKIFEAGSFYEPLGPWIWFLPFGVWLYGASQIMMSALNREKAYRTMSIADIWQALSISGGRLVTGTIFGTSIAGLLLPFLLGYIVNVSILKSNRISLMQLCLCKPDWRRLVKVAKEYKDFALYDTPSALAISLSNKMPIFFMGLIFSPAIAGFYAMSERLIKVPINTASNSIRRVFLRKIAGFRSSGKSVALSFWKVVGVMALSGIVPFLLLVMSGEEIITFILGEKWRVAGHYSEILAPWFFSAWITVVVPSIMIAFRKQSMWAGIQITSALIRIVIFIIAYRLTWEPELTLIAFVWTNVGISTILLLFAWRVIEVEEHGV